MRDIHDIIIAMMIHNKHIQTDMANATNLFHKLGKGTLANVWNLPKCKGPANQIYPCRTTPDE